MRFNRGALAFLMIVLPGAFWPGSTAYEAAKFLVLSLVCGALLLNLAWRINRRQALAQPSRRQLSIWLGLLLVIALSGLFAVSISLLLRTWLLVATWICLMWLTATCVDRISNLQLLLAALTVGAVLPAVYGLAQIHGLVAGAIDSGVPPGISTFGNENQMAGLAALAIWPALGLVVLSRSRILLWASTAGVLILLAAVVAAEATGPRLAVAGAVLVVLPSSLLLRLGARRFVPGLIWAVAGSGLVATIFVFACILEPGFAARWPLPDLISRWLADNHGNIRRTDWLVACHLVNHHAGLNGAGNYQLLWPEVRAALTHLPHGADLAAYIPLATRAHNEYLQALAELGVPGCFYLTVTAGGLLLGLQRWWHTVTTTRLAQVGLLLLGAISTTAIYALVSFPLHLPAPGFALAIIFGLLGSPVFCTDPPQPSTWLAPRRLAMAPLLIGMLVAGLGGREFVADLHAARGERAYVTRALPQALAELRRANDQMIWPQLSQLYEGLTLMALDQDTQAHDHLAASLKCRPSYEALLALAELETARTEYATALGRLNLVDDCRPSQNFRNEALYLRSMVYLRQENYPRARQILDELLTTDPRNHRGLLASGYLSLLSGKPGDAEQYYRRALRTIDEDLLQNNDPVEAARLNAVRQTALKAVASVRN